MMTAVSRFILSPRNGSDPRSTRYARLVKQVFARLNATRGRKSSDSLNHSLGAETCICKPRVRVVSVSTIGRQLRKSAIGLEEPDGTVGKVPHQIGITTLGRISRPCDLGS